MGALRRGLVAFGRFWLDFFVGDTPELFVAMLVLVGLAFALRDHRTAAIVTLPVVAAIAVLASAFRGRRRTSGTEDGPG